MPVANKTMIDAGLRKAGFGGLTDPSLFDQIAMVISGRTPAEGHARFRSMLLSVEPDKRRIAYQAIAPKLRFKAYPLEDYERQGAVIADQRHLPSYDPTTLKVEDWKPQEIETQEHKQTKLEEYASNCISHDLREENAKQQLTLVCERCTFERKWRVKRRSSAYKLATQEGWDVKGWQGKQATICSACNKSRLN